MELVLAGAVMLWLVGMLGNTVWLFFKLLGMIGVPVIIYALAYVLVK